MTRSSHLKIRPQATHAICRISRRNPAQKHGGKWTFRANNFSSLSNFSLQSLIVSAEARFVDFVANAGAPHHRDLISCRWRAIARRRSLTQIFCQELVTCIGNLNRSTPTSKTNRYERSQLKISNESFIPVEISCQTKRRVWPSASNFSEPTSVIATYRWWINKVTVELIKHGSRLNTAEIKCR